MGANPLSSTNKSAAYMSGSDQKQHSQTQKGAVLSPATLGQISVKGINGPPSGGVSYDNFADQGASPSKFNSTMKFNSSQGMKFKKKSQIEERSLNKILDSKARISINSQTGKHEFKYCSSSG